MDKAGNTLKMYKEFKRNGKVQIYSIKSIIYNDLEVFNFDKNLYSVVFNLDKKSDSLNHVIQRWFDKKDTLITVIYKNKENESEIIRKDKGDKLEKEKRQGLILLYIYTNNGNLEFGYE